MLQALIIFVRNPIAGKVKTRLAKSLGDAQTVEIYKLLLQHTHDITYGLPVDRYVFYQDFINPDDLWESSHYHKMLQVGSDLGSRMQNAFAALFERQYSHVVIIGSDCLELTATLIMQSFSGLKTNDCVLGPASDGGYYLLGMKHLIPGIFANKEWSTSRVLEFTLTDLKKQRLEFELLKELRDIDVEEDIDWDKIKGMQGN